MCNGYCDPIMAESRSGNSGDSGTFDPDLEEYEAEMEIGETWLELDEQVDEGETPSVLTNNFGKFSVCSDFFQTLKDWFQIILCEKTSTQH